MYLKCVLCLLPLALTLSFVQKADFTMAVLKFVYQKDMSEHCRRRVMPSVFLGRHVMESQSQILHFSQLEVPYSCFVVVRTESGSNIILVLQIAGAEEEGPGSDKCYRPDESQVTVHELGETFGGYWGPLPDVVLPANQPTAKHRYTRPTTTPTTPLVDEGTIEEQTTTKGTSGMFPPMQTKPKKDYIRVEIPLVNVSGPFANDPEFLNKIENYDRMNDAMRSPGVSYHSTLLPLVQFSLSNALPPNRRVDDQTSEPEAAPEPRYDLQFFPAALTKNNDDTTPFDDYTTLQLIKKMPFSTKITTDIKMEYWQYIDDLLKNLKNISLKEYTNSKPGSLKYNNISSVSQKFAEPHNISAYVDRSSWMFASPRQEILTTKREASTHETVSPKTARLTITKNSFRGKRFIHPIAIDNARPHFQTTLQEVATTSESIYQFSDIQDFAHLVELEDDNIYGRIALRHLHRYLGKLLFDLCNHNETKGRHVFLFNSSRIVIAINNFTMKRMTVVATPARTLMHAESRCASDHIECQVSGARVCVDGMAACDGVPNCGAYDIYDEDRLRCGAFRGLQHSVVLAALVFLAVLMTLLYTVHYWLKRCVPRVSKAFFIYTNGSENVLYLDSVMRSPTDFDNESRLVYTSNIFDAEDLSMVIGSDNERKKSSFLKRICSLFAFRRSKVVQSIVTPDSIDIGTGPLTPYETRKPQKPSHSLAELELAKMMSKRKEDIGVQTGKSLEIAQSISSKEGGAPRVFISQRKKGSEDAPRRSHDSELNLLQIIRTAKKPEQKKQMKEVERTPHEWENRVSSRVYAAYDVATGDEEELESTFYESSKFMSAEDSFVVPIDVHEDPKLSKKKLRFEENATAIRNEEEEKTEERRNQASLHDELPVELDVEHGGREFMRFFGGKSKRTKKKSHPSIR